MNCLQFIAHAMAWSRDISDELCWFLLLFVMPFTCVLIFPYLRNWLIRHSSRVNEFDPSKQYKVALKMIRSVYYTIAWVIGMCACWIWPVNFEIFFAPESAVSSPNEIKNAGLNYYQDKILKIGIVLILSGYLVDLTHGRSYIKWPSWCHHIASLILYLMLYPNPNVLTSFSFVNVIMNRFFALVFGCLLSFIFFLQIASVYYYLGNNDQWRLRKLLYVFGMISQIIFVFGQLSFSILVKVVRYDYVGFNPINLIAIIVFEFCVLPAQVLSLYDIYCILKYKIHKPNKFTNVAYTNHAVMAGGAPPTKSPNFITVPSKVSIDIMKNNSNNKQTIDGVNVIDVVGNSNRNQAIAMDNLKIEQEMNKQISYSITRSIDTALFRALSKLLDANADTDPMDPEFGQIRLFKPASVPMEVIDSRQASVESPIETKVMKKFHSHA